MSNRFRLDLFAAILLIIAAGSLANAFWMFLAPRHWYDYLPAHVPEFGPFNVHFVRDFGCGFFMAAVAMIWGALRPALRGPMAAISAVYYGAHALIHVYDTLRGLVHQHHWYVDFPLTYLPAILLTWIAIGCSRAKS